MNVKAPAHVPEMARYLTELVQEVISEFRPWMVEVALSKEQTERENRRQ
jgi:hypothetical protein